MDDLGMGFEPGQQAAQRRVLRPNDQSMIPPRQAEGDRAGGIAATPVGEPPFAALGLIEVAADRPAKADHVRYRDPPLSGRPVVLLPTTPAKIATASTPQTIVIKARRKPTSSAVMPISRGPARETATPAR